MVIVIEIVIEIVIVHPVSVRRFPSFRTQPLESLTPLPMTKTISEQPSPWRKYSKRESCYGDRVYANHTCIINTCVNHIECKSYVNITIIVLV